LKTPAGLVRFWFYKPETKKTKPNPNKKKIEPNRFKPVFVLKNQTETKQEKTEPNRFKPVFVLKNQTETGWFELVSVFLKKNKFRFGFFF